MAQFRYLGDDARVFPHVSLTVEPGDVVDLSENPDPRWFTEAPAPAKTPKTED